MYVSEVCLCVCKQKTAYEMRISDWSSDVCSSDLVAGHHEAVRVRLGRAVGIDRRQAGVSLDAVQHIGSLGIETVHPLQQRVRILSRQNMVDVGRNQPNPLGLMRRDVARAILEPRRSEEHTSELQSLMRISYAVFCLKTKNKHTIT